MADHIQEELGAESEFIESGGGIFDVHLDDERIYSKFETYRFPEHGEIVDKIKRAVRRGG